MYPFLKRLFDLSFACLLLFILSPILLTTIILLKIIEKEEIFFIQKRVGHKNQAFWIMKFRTMIRNAAQAGSGAITGKNDMRITPIGKFLRNSKIDEFPQLINVLKGDMSFVGARPLMRVPDFESYSPEVQAVIYDTRPGLTAIGSVVFRDEAQLISQVQELGEDAREFKQKVVFPYKGALEMWYQANKSLWVDFKILFLTAWTLIFSTSQLAFKAFKDLPERPERLKVEFNRMQALRESVTLVLLVLLVLVPLVPPPFWFYNNPHFVLMALIPTLSFGYLWLRKGHGIPIKVIPMDMAWGGFLLMGLLSFFWATDGSLVWHPWFTWVSLVFWMLLIRALSLKEKMLSILPILFGAFFLMMLMQHLAAIFFNVAIGHTWNAFFGKNEEYTSTLLVSVYPFLLFYPSEKRLLDVLKFVVTLGVIGILYITEAKWATLGFLFVGLYYLWNQSKRKDLKGLEISLTILGLGAMILMFDKIEGSFSAIGNEIASLDTSFRYYLMKASVWNLLEYPFTGVGLGNWHIEAFKHDFSSVPVLNNPKALVRFRSHNIFFEHFAELGFLGGMAFLLPFLDVLRKSATPSIKFTEFQQAAFASLLVYTVASFFYSDANAYRYHFSAIQLLAFCSLGILTSHSYYHRLLPKWTNALFMLFSMAAVAWFLYTKLNYDRFNMQLQQKNKAAIETLHSIYHPITQTTYSYEYSIPFELAKRYDASTDKILADSFYQTALALMPYHEPLLLSYATFLLKDNQLKEAKVYAQKVYRIQPNHYETNMLLAKIASKEANKEAFKKYVDYLKSVDYEKVEELQFF